MGKKFHKKNEDKMIKGFLLEDYNFFINTNNNFDWFNTTLSTSYKAIKPNG